MKLLLYIRWKHYTSVVAPCAASASASGMHWNSSQHSVSIAAHSVAASSLCAGTPRARYSGVAAPIDAVSATLRITDDSKATYIFKNVAPARHSPACGVNAFTGRPRFNACRRARGKNRRDISQLMLIASCHPLDTHSISIQYGHRGDKKIKNARSRKIWLEKWFSIFECDKVYILYMDN